MNDLWQNLHLENGYITFEKVEDVTKRRGLVLLNYPDLSF